MTPTQQHHTLITAKKHAGGFFSYLAEAALHADPLNRDRVFGAFPELISGYGPGTTLYLHR